jgi:hypothetical protein
VPNVRDRREVFSCRILWSNRGRVYLRVLNVEGVVLSVRGDWEEEMVRAGLSTGAGGNVALKSGEDLAVTMLDPRFENLLTVSPGIQERLHLTDVSAVLKTSQEEMMAGVGFVSIADHKVEQPGIRSTFPEIGQDVEQSPGATSGEPLVGDLLDQPLGLLVLLDLGSHTKLIVLGEETRRVVQNEGGNVHQRHTWVLSATAVVRAGHHLVVMGSSTGEKGPTMKNDSHVGVVTGGVLLP